jgi:hypothetical protein
VNHNARVTAASRPLILGGDTWNLSPFTMRDIEEMDAWLQAKYINNARLSMDGENLSEAQRSELLQSAIAGSITITMISTLGSKLLRTPQGMARLMWQMAKRNHPGISCEQFKESMFNPENVNAIVQTFNDLNKDIGTAKAKNQEARKSKAR